GLIGLTLVLFLSSHAGITAQQGQGPALPDIRGQLVPAGRITGVANYAQTVTNLDAAVAFYHDALGFEPIGQPGRPQVDSAVNRLYNTPNAQYRSFTLRIPKTPFGMHLMEFTGIDRKTTLSLRSTDPGVSDLNFVVQDELGTWSRMMAAGGKMLSW